MKITTIEFTVITDITKRSNDIDDNIATLKYWANRLERITKGTKQGNTNIALEAILEYATRLLATGEFESAASIQTKDIGV